jgi:hypothetical protein
MSDSTAAPPPERREAQRRLADAVALEHYREAARKWLREQPLMDPDSVKQSAIDKRLLVDAFDIMEVLLWASSPAPHAERPMEESTVREFIGWLSVDISELHNVEVPRLAESFERFKARAALSARVDS